MPQSTEIEWGIYIKSIYLLIRILWVNLRLEDLYELQKH